MNKHVVNKDKLGMFLSGLCIIHCLLTPLTLLLLGSSALLGWFASEWIHVALYLPVVLLVLISIIPTCIHLKAYRLLFLAAAGLIAMTVSFGFHGAAELVLSIVGAACIFTAHFMNLRLQRRCLSANLLP